MRPKALESMIELSHELEPHLDLHDKNLPPHSLAGQAYDLAKRSDDVLRAVREAEKLDQESKPNNEDLGKSLERLERAFGRAVFEIDRLNVRVKQAKIADKIGNRSLSISLAEDARIIANGTKFSDDQDGQGAEVFVEELKSEIKHILEETNEDTHSQPKTDTQILIV